MKLFISFFCFFFFAQIHASQGHASSTLMVDGFLNDEKIHELKTALEQLDEKPTKTITLIISSQSGELLPSLDFLRNLYAYKKKHAATISAIINEEALGPAAMFPFIADTIMVTQQVTWGAIVSGKTDVPINVLRSRVQGVIPADSPHYDTLKLAASAMIDPEVQIVETKEGYEETFSLERGQKLISRQGETLVLNQTQIKTLQIAKTIESIEPFLEKKEPEPMVQAVDTPEHVQTFEQKLQKFVKFPEGQSLKVGYIALTNRKEAISDATWIYINQALTFYKKLRPSCIIFEINSPGGEIFAAEQISDALKEMDTQYDIPIICYINNWAISAGAMLAYSSRFIVVAKDASMGAAEPVIMGQGGGPQTASEKISSALRTDFANRAEYFDRNPNLAEAMVDKDLIVVKRHGKIIKLNSEEQIRREGLDPDLIISQKGKLLTLNANQLMAFGVADYEIIPQKILPLTDQELETGIWPIAKTSFGQIPFFQNAEVISYQQSWQTSFLAFLASPVISSLLMMVLLVSIYLEISTPGFGVAGSLGLIALFFIILSSFALEAIHWLEPILLLFGLALIGLELFVFPTIGILGFVGGVLVVVALVAMMIPGIEKISYDGDTLNAAGEYVLTRLTWLSGAFLTSLAIIALLSRVVWPKFRLVQRFVLTDEQQSGALVASMSETPLTKVPNVGDMAIVISTLRPAGKIAIGDEEYDAVSTGEFLSEGCEVKVIRIEGHKVIVQEKLG